jgi:hypothetical protein
MPLSPPPRISLPHMTRNPSKQSTAAAALPLSSFSSAPSSSPRRRPSPLPATLALPRYRPRRHQRAGAGCAPAAGRAPSSSQHRWPSFRALLTVEEAMHVLRLDELLACSPSVCAGGDFSAMPPPPAPSSMMPTAALPCSATHRMLRCCHDSIVLGDSEISVSDEVKEQACFLALHLLDGMSLYTSFLWPVQHLHSYPVA